ncbi:KR domain-containing protein [Luteimonas wenzhouensis]|uniref:KR domain-containing protein n=1 Tax=Luteimonas wenzhouensis TaxID=2599615 RepID=A0A5C5TVZ2_9GAMM|nr:KR domain-containing protein [Luteimonas wenzhouensis]TWT18383.1 KR domain-containing protein [Luteimonas wenzhouensis]
MYAILGATGQVGRAVVASLAADGHAARMRLIGRTPSADAPAGAAAFEAGAAAFAPADLEVAGEESFEDVLRRALA